MTKTPKKKLCDPPANCNAIICSVKRYYTHWRLAFLLLLLMQLLQIVVSQYSIIQGIVSAIYKGTYQNQWNNKSTCELVGLLLSYALALTNTHVFLKRRYCSLSNYAISVERIKQYMHIPAEPAAVVEGNRPLSSWPSKGRTEVHDVK